MLERVAAPAAGARSPAGTERPIRVFVHLARDKDPDAWRRAFEAGTLVGLNEETPYGYGRAERMGCTVVFSRSHKESLPGKGLRLALRVLAGFDYLHARRQGQALAEADVVWTHTESQFLAVAAVLGPGDRPRLLGQSVWLFDRWPRLAAPYRALYRRLIRRVGVMTFHSVENMAVAAALFPGKWLALVPYGIRAEDRIAPAPRPAGPIRILAPGSDRHRDWATLVAAVRGRADMSLTILSGSADPALARGLDNVRIARATTNDALKREFAEATLVCVPLHENKHASGITVIQEAVLSGVPVVATATGGLSGYFGEGEVRYVPPRDPAALRAALLAIGGDAEAASAMAVRAQARMTADDLGAERFVRRHVELSREMLRR